MRQPLSERQKELLGYVRDAMARTGRCPSLREAAAALGVSHTAVAGTLRLLQDKGWLSREGRYSRVIRLREEDGDPCPGQGIRIPIVGRVAAGLPLYAQQEWDGELLVDARVYRGRQLFALRVRGDSMRGAGILDGDLVICEPRQYAESGEIVVALVHGEEATVKRFFYRGDHIELRPENPAFAPMRYGLGEALVQGRVVGLQRGAEGFQRS